MLIDIARYEWILELAMIFA